MIRTTRRQRIRSKMRIRRELGMRMTREARNQNNKKSIFLGFGRGGWAVLESLCRGETLLVGIKSKGKNERTSVPLWDFFFFLNQGKGKCNSYNVDVDYDLIVGVMLISFSCAFLLLFSKLLDLIYWASLRREGYEDFRNY